MTENNLFTDEGISTVFDNLQLITYLDEDTLVVSHLCDMPSYMFACYLYDHKNQVIHKKRYQHKHGFFFKINQTELESVQDFSIRYFLRDFSAKKRKSKNFKLIDTMFYKVSEPSIEIHNVVDGKLKVIFESVTHQRNGSMIAEGQLLLKLFKPVLIENWEIWEKNPFKNRTWQWQLHSFNFMLELISYHHISKDDRVLYSAKQAIEKWEERYFDRSGITFEFIWHDHATALRAENFLEFVYYVRKYVPEWAKENIDFLRKVDYLVFLMGCKLTEDEFYTEHTNHGLEQVRVLLLLSVYFDHRDWLKVAKCRLLSEIKFSFTNEGVHKENSPSYHQFVFKIFLNILKDYPSTMLEEVGDYFAEIAPKALEYVTHIIRPDGNLPNIGDTELKRTSDGYDSYFAGTPEYKQFLYSYRQGRAGNRPTERIKAYPESGYVIYRDRWHPRDSFSQAVHLVFKAGCLSGYHSQQDENHFVLYAYGEDWFIDSGLYKYVKTDPIRVYMRQRIAHNVPLISDSSYLHDDFEHRINNWSLTTNLEDYDYYSVLGENTVLQTVKHGRELKIPKEREGLFNFRLVDSIQGLDKKSRSVCFLWHVPLDKNISVKNNQLIIESQKTGKKLIMTLQKPANVVIEKGTVDGRIVSCISKVVGKVEDSWVVKVFYERVRSIEVSSDIYFIDDKKALKPLPSFKLFA